MNNIDAYIFLFDRNGTDVRDLCYHMFNVSQIETYRTYYCTVCEVDVENDGIETRYIWYCLKSIWWNRSDNSQKDMKQQSTTTLVDAITKSLSNHECSVCNLFLLCKFSFDKNPAFVPLAINNNITIHLDHYISINKSIYRLIGIIYHGGFHFTTHIIDKNGDILYNDRIETK